MSGNAVPRAVERPAEEEPGRRRVSPLFARVAAGSLLVLGLGVYAALVDELPDLTLWWDVALAAFVLMPATLALAWLALPLRTWEGVAAAGLVLVALALACELAGLDVLGNFAKALAVILLALAFVGFFERPWWIALVALAIPLVDAISVWRGPTRHIVTERPAVFDLLSIAFPVPGGSFQLGLPDVLFFTLFLAAAARWSMRIGASWVLMTASFGGTMALALWLDPFGLGGLPALPLLSLAFLVANGDLLLRSLRPAPVEPVRHLRAVPAPEPEPAPRPALVLEVAPDDAGWHAVGLEDGAPAFERRHETLADVLDPAAAAIAVSPPSAAALADRLYLGPAARRLYLELLRDLPTARDEAEAVAMCRILGWDGITGECLAYRRRVLEVEAARADPRVTVVDAGTSAADAAAQPIRPSDG